MLPPSPRQVPSLPKKCFPFLAVIKIFNLINLFSPAFYFYASSFFVETTHIVTCETIFQSNHYNITPMLSYLRNSAEKCVSHLQLLMISLTVCENNLDTQKRDEDQSKSIIHIAAHKNFLKGAICDAQVCKMLVSKTDMLLWG